MNVGGTLGTLFGTLGTLFGTLFGSLRGRNVVFAFVFVAGVLLDDRDALPERLVRDGVAGAVLGAVVVVRVLGLRRDRRRGRVADAVDDVIVLVGIVAVLLDGDGPRGVLRRRRPRRRRRRLPTSRNRRGPSRASSPPPPFACTR